MAMDAKGLVWQLFQACGTRKHPTASAERGGVRRYPRPESLRVRRVRKAGERVKAKEVAKKLNGVRDLIPVQDVTKVLTAILEAHKEERTSRIEMKKVQVAREVALTSIRLKHDLYRQVFERIFEERRDAITKHFEIIDKGIAANNQELILGALKGLGQIVAASPFSDLKQL